MDLIKFLYSRYEWVTIAELSKELKCSQRVIKDDLAFFKSSVVVFEIESSFKGIRINFSHNKGLKSVYQAILSESNTFKLLELTLLNEHASVSELVNSLYVSESTLYRLISELNKALKRHFDIGYSSNPFRIVGDEQKIRFFYYTYFSERYSKIEWPFTTINEAALDDLLKMFIQVSKKTINFAYYGNLKLIVTVNLFRYRNNNLMNLPLEQTNLEEVLPDLSPYKETLFPIEARLGIRFSHETILELFNNFVRYDYSLSYDRLLQKTINDKRLHNSVDNLSKLINELSKRYNLEVTNKEEIILHVSNAAFGEGFEAKSRYILYDRNQQSVTRLAKHFPNFFQDMFNGLEEYCKLIKIPITPYTMDYIIYTFCSYWGNLITALQNKWTKVKLVIVSELSNGHAKLLEDVINYSMGNRVEIIIYDYAFLSEEKLKQLGCDIVIANFPLPFYADIQSVYIENIPSVKNLKTVSELVDQVSFVNSNRTYYMGV